MNSGSLASYSVFKRQLNKLQQQLFVELISKHRTTISVSDKTALKNLGNIFAATLKIANKKGFAAMSLRELSAETGMSLGSIYTYIKAKDDLIMMMQSHHINLAETVFKKVIDPKLSSKQALSDALKAHLYLSQAMSSWFYFSFTESKHLSRKIIELAKQSELKSEHFFSQILSQGIKDKSFRCVDPQLSAALIKAMLQDWYLKPWKYKLRKISLDHYIQHIESVLANYLFENR